MPGVVQGIVCKFDSPLPAGASATIELTVIPGKQIGVGDLEDLFRGDLQNFVRVEGNEPDPNRSNNVARVHVAVATPVDLAVVKAASLNTAVVGQPITYVVTVINNGETDADDVRLIDLFPGGAVNILEVSASQGTCSLPIFAEDLGPICSLGTIPAGTAVTVRFVAVPLTVPESGYLVNNATVIPGDSQVDVSPDDNQFTLRTPVVDLRADLSITKVASSARAKVGEPLTYTITVTNNGPADATRVSVTDTQSKVTVVSTDTSQGSCYMEGFFFPGDGFVTVTGCSIPALPSGASATIQIVVVPNLVRSDGFIVNNARVSELGRSFDPDLDNNEARVATPVVEVREADLEVTKIATFSPDGDLLTYTITATNHGPDVATGVKVTELLPGDTRIDGVLRTVAAFVSAASTHGTCTRTGTVLECELGTLAVGETATITVVLDTLFAADFFNNVRIRGNEHDPRIDNDFAFLVTPVTTTGPADQSFIVAFERPGSVTNGDGTIVRFTAQDLIVLTDRANGVVELRLAFDGSDVGLNTRNENIDAVTITTDGAILISTVGPFNVPGPSGKPLRGNANDVLKFEPTLLGDMTTGTWSVLLRGSELGMPPRSNISALAMAGNQLLVSAIGQSGFQVDGQLVRPEDVVAVELGTPPVVKIYFDGSDVGLGDQPGEGIDLLSRRHSLELSTIGPLTAPGVNAPGSDVLIFNAVSLGSNTQGTFDPQPVIRPRIFPPFVAGDPIGPNFLNRIVRRAARPLGPPVVVMNRVRSDVPLAESSGGSREGDPTEDRLRRADLLQARRQRPKPTGLVPANHTAALDRVLADLASDRWSRGF